jgi:hypothetical protein
MSKQKSGTTASAAPAEGAAHLAASALTPATEAVILSLGASQGLNAFKVPAPSKPAQ